MKSGKLEPGAVCVVVGDHPNYERNIGALITLTRLNHCPCGCGTSAWEFEAASRPIMISFMRDLSAVIYPMHFVNASAEADAITEWPKRNGRPAFRPAFLIPIKGEDLDTGNEEEAPTPLEAETIQGMPGFARTWNCRCVLPNL